MPRQRIPVPFLNDATSPFLQLDPYYLMRQQFGIGPAPLELLTPRESDTNTEQDRIRNLDLPPAPPPLADVLRSGPPAYNFVSQPNVARAVADAPTLLNWANAPSPSTMADVVRLGLEQLGPKDMPEGTAIMPGLPNPSGLPLTKAMRGGKPIMVYRGTQAPYTVEDPTKWDPYALKGPGAYYTENPEIASGYAATKPSLFFWGAREQNLLDYKRSIQQEGADLKAMRANLPAGLVGVSGPTLPEIQRNIIKGLAQEYARLYKTAPNVRPAFLDVANPLIENQVIPHQQIVQALDNLRRYESVYKGPRATDVSARDITKAVNEMLSAGGGVGGTEAMTGRDFVSALSYAGLRDSEINPALLAAGYDAIKYRGGGRLNPGSTRHNVWVTFRPEAEVNPYQYYADVLRHIAEQKALK